MISFTCVYLSLRLRSNFFPSRDLLVFICVPYALPIFTCTHKLKALQGNLAFHLMYNE